MEKFVIKGPSKGIKGSINIDGAKNSVLPLMAASILFDDYIILKNVPFVKDVYSMINVLKALGSTIQISEKEKKIKIINKKKHNFIVPYKLTSTMRSSVLTMGALLGKYKNFKCALIGGCSLGPRPINYHLNGFEKLGAKYSLLKGYVNCKAKKLNGNKIEFPKVSVTGTSNLIMASVFANGVTTLKNASIEPETLDLCQMLIKAGANIKFKGKRTIEIKGIKKLNSITHQVIGDRIEAFSYLCVGAITKGNIKINNINPFYLKSELNILKKIGCNLKIKNNSIEIKNNNKLKSVKIKTSPWPGFATDNMPMLMAVLTLAKGKSEIIENIFSNRFAAAPELVRMNAKITIKKNKATIIGQNRLESAECISSDLRSTFSIILGAVAAYGESTIFRIYHGLRGYYEIDKKLRKIGIKIKKIS